MNERVYRAVAYRRKVRQARQQRREALAQWAALAAFVISLSTCIYVFWG